MILVKYRFGKNPDTDFDLIGVVAHQYYYLKYLDKLYEKLLKNKILMLYIIRNDKKMIKYCLEQGRRFIILDIVKPNLFNILFTSYTAYLLKKRAIEILRKFQIKLVLLTVDTGSYFDIIVQATQKLQILTFLLQCATTLPHYILKYNRKILFIKKKKLLYRLRNKIIDGYAKVVNYPFYYLFKVKSKIKNPSFAKGKANIVGVINEYSKQLFIKQGVDGKKIKVVGSMHYDDALKMVNKNYNEIKQKLQINDVERVIVYFSQPFYKKDVYLLTFKEQLEYLREIVDSLDKFYIKKNKSYKLFIKLHPSEDINDYIHSIHNDNVIFMDDVDNNELILVSDLFISQHSTTIQSAIAMNKPVISLNILKLSTIKIGSNSAGITKTVNSWEDFTEILEILEKNNYRQLDNVNYDRILLDGRSYQRIITIIRKLINITKKIQI